MSHADQPRVEETAREIPLAVGEDSGRGGLSETPGRVARAYRELFSGLVRDPAELLSITFDIDREELVLVRDIELTSCCEHHLLPFFGVAHVGYIPGDGRVAGLSKLARLVDIYTHHPQVREHLTTRAAGALVTYLDAQSVTVVIEAEHTCMTMQGVRKPGSRIITSVVRRQLRSAVTRAEAMSLTMVR